VIDLGSEQVIEPIHGGGEQHALIGRASAPSDKFCQKSLAHTWIADQYKIGAFVEERQIEQTQDARLGLLAALVMEEVKGIDAGLRLQTRAFDWTGPSDRLCECRWIAGGARDVNPTRNDPLRLVIYANLFISAT
jgi:hypothetical protein